jgi:N6-adenosine-specific RNA methylase IME4
MSDWPFGGLSRNAYGVILSDPPWRFRTWGEHNQTKSPSRHYDLMTLDDIKALPVATLAAADCLLFMWACAPTLDQSFDVMASWGFKFKTAGAWAKQSKTGRKWAFGTGYLLRSAAEFYLIGTIGNPKSAVRDVRNLTVAPVREHSRKPDSVRDDLERMFPSVRKAELFGRTEARGWDVWGNQTEKFEAPMSLFNASVAATDLFSGAPA